MKRVIFLFFIMSGTAKAASEPLDLDFKPFDFDLSAAQATDIPDIPLMGAQAPDEMVQAAIRGTTLDFHLMGATNHTEAGATAAREPTVELAPGVEVPAYNEQNWGLAIGMTRKNTWWMLGKYRNSFWEDSYILLSGVGIRAGPYLFGVAVGFWSGYSERVEATGAFFITTDTFTVLSVPKVGYHIMAKLYQVKF